MKEYGSLCANVPPQNRDMGHPAPSNEFLKQKKFDPKCNQHRSSYGAYQTTVPVRDRASKRRNSVGITCAEILANESQDDPTRPGNDEYDTHIFPNLVQEAFGYAFVGVDAAVA
ncbi:MAG TPA: hypothetical protein VIX90_13115 [Edaphobacter sp.]